MIVNVHVRDTKNKNKVVVAVDCWQSTFEDAARFLMQSGIFNRVVEGEPGDNTTTLTYYPPASIEKVEYVIKNNSAK